LLSAAGAFGQSGQHGDGHAQMHGTYKNWTPPNNPKTSCCNDSDCRPTRAYLGDDGLWRAWNGYQWLTVPRERVLPTDLAGDGRNHICEKQEFIYCFSPTVPKG
jgi:hypothetical protein